MFYLDTTWESVTAHPIAPAERKRADNNLRKHLSTLPKGLMQPVASCFHVDELAVDVPNLAPAVYPALQVRDPKVEALIPLIPFFLRHEVGVEAITFLHLAEDNVIDRDLFSQFDGGVSAPVAGTDHR